MTLPVKYLDDMPASFQFWATPDLGRGPVVAHAACMRALLTLVKSAGATTSLDRAAALIKTIKSIPSDWKRGFPPDVVTQDPIVQVALGMLAKDPEWQDDVAGFIRRGRHGEAMGKGQFLDLVPILHPHGETPGQRSAWMQRAIIAFRERVPDAQECVIAGLIDQAMTALLADPEVIARAAPEESEWVLESGPIYEDMEHLGNYRFRLPYPQDDFPDRLEGEERLDFLHEMHGRIAEGFERDDGRSLCEIAGAIWLKSRGVRVEKNPLLATISPVLPVNYYIGDLKCFGKRGQGVDERVAFLRAIEGFRGDVLTAEDTIRTYLVHNDFFHSQWGPGGGDTRDHQDFADVARKLGVR